MQEKSVMPAPADIKKIADELAETARIRAGGERQTVEWIQVIRDHKTDDVLERRHLGQHLAPLEIGLKYGDRMVRTSMQRDPPLEDLEV